MMSAPYRRLEGRAARDQKSGVQMSTATVYDHDRDLFLDWCAAFGRTPVPAGSDDVDEFLTATAVTDTLRARRLRAIHHGNLRAGIPLASGQAPPDMLRVGDPWVSVSRALAQTPATGTRWACGVGAMPGRCLPSALSNSRD